jgi:hypothetical protein
MLDDPHVNFAISSGAKTPAIGHLGLQVESDEDLAAVGQRLNAAGECVLEQENATCCYARGNKRWVNDPSGIPWETFRTFGESTVYHAISSPLRRPRSNNPLRLAACQCTG